MLTANRVGFGAFRLFVVRIHDYDGTLALTNGYAFGCARIEYTHRVLDSIERVCIEVKCRQDLHAAIVSVYVQIGGRIGQQRVEYLFTKHLNRIIRIGVQCWHTGAIETESYSI